MNIVYESNEPWEIYHKDAQEIVKYCKAKKEGTLEFVTIKEGYYTTFYFESVGGNNETAEISRAYVKNAPWIL